MSMFDRFKKTISTKASEIITEGVKTEVCAKANDLKPIMNIVLTVAVVTVCAVSLKSSGATKAAAQTAPIVINNYIFDPTKYIKG